MKIILYYFIYIFLIYIENCFSISASFGESFNATSNNNNNWKIKNYKIATGTNVSYAHGIIQLNIIMKEKATVTLNTIAYFDVSVPTGFQNFSILSDIDIDIGLGFSFFKNKY